MLKHKAIANNYDMMAISYCYNIGIFGIRTLLCIKY